MSGLSGALCVGEHELFESTELTDHREAAAICAKCPAIVACRALLRAEASVALAAYGGPVGTWAGELIASGKRKPREHGTERGYQQHRHLAEHRCEPCRKAHNAHISGWTKAQVKPTNRTPERVELGADKRSPSRVLGRSATEASTDYEGVGS